VIGCDSFRTRCQLARRWSHWSESGPSNRQSTDRRSLVLILIVVKPGLRANAALLRNQRPIDAGVGIGVASTVKPPFLCPGSSACASHIEHPENRFAATARGAQLYQRERINLQKTHMLGEFVFALAKIVVGHLQVLTSNMCFSPASRSCVQTPSTRAPLVGDSTVRILAPRKSERIKQRFPVPGGASSTSEHRSSRRLHPLTPS
jgi:hypothetical protein